MKKLLLSTMLAVCAIGTAQITTKSDYTPEQLVNDVLLLNSGITAINITSSSANTFEAGHSIGYFANNGSPFSFESGVVLSSGSLNDVPGPFPTTYSNIGLWPGDAEIHIPGGWLSYDASSVEFDFVAPTDFFSFDYIYATGESAGTDEFCNPIDAFAFILTDSDGNKINLAVLPGTTTPVSNTSVNNGVDGSTICTGNLMIEYGSYLTPPAPDSPINFQGVTTPLTAQAQVIAGETYHLKIVVGDVADSAIHSAVFMRQGSFNTAQLSTDIPDPLVEFTAFPNPVDNVLNLSNGNEIESVTLYNMLGQQLKFTAPQSTLATIDISHLSPGSYIVKATSVGKEKNCIIIKK